MWMKAEWENWTGMKKKLKWSPRWAERSCEEKETESTVVVQWWDSSTYFAKTRNRSSCNLLSHTSENRALIYRLRTISTAVTGCVEFRQFPHRNVQRVLSGTILFLPLVYNCVNGVLFVSKMKWMTLKARERDHALFYLEMKIHREMKHRKRMYHFS